MAYSRSAATVEKILPHLAPIIEGRTHKWDVPSGRAWWWAGKVREAFHIARTIYPNKYPRLAVAASHYTVEVLDDHTVQARPTANTPATAIGTGEGLVETETSRSDVTPIHGLEIAGGVPRTIVGMRTATDIISFWLQAQPTNDKLVFTDTRLDDTELDQLARWANARAPRWMVVVSRNEGIVTLSPFQPGIPAWTPRIS